MADVVLGYRSGDATGLAYSYTLFSCLHFSICLVA